MIVKNGNNMHCGNTKQLSPLSTPSVLRKSSLSSTSRPNNNRNRETPQEFLPPQHTTKLSPLSKAAFEFFAFTTLTNKSLSVRLPPLKSASLSSTAQLTDGTGVVRTSTKLSGKTKLCQQPPSRHCLIKQQRQQHQQPHHHSPQLRFRLLPGLKTTSFFTILTLVCLETVLLSTVSNCAKTFYMHWNTSNSIFRIDNTDHIIDVNKGNLAFEFDQVHIICPVYEPGTFENETEKYIIYNVSKVEYETCRITNADPRVIAICDKPQKLMFFTITFRPFTPQPGGLEFLPGNDYYFISTSSKDDLYRRIGGRCSTNNMKVVFKVCCAPEDRNNRTKNIGNGSISGGGNSNGGSNIGLGISNSGNSNNNAETQQHHNNNINVNGGGGGGQLPSPKLPGMGGSMNNGGGLIINGNSGTSINTNIDQYNRIPMQQPNNIGGGIMGMNGIGGNGGASGQHPTGIRINNVPSSQQHPSQKNGMHGGFIAPMANINTNSSNVVQSTISWPDWGNHNNLNGEHGGGGIDGFNVQQHSTPVSTIGIHPHFYPSHITSPRPFINSAVNNKSNYSPSHKPPKKTNDYDKHPNEVVKNEELTYNSAASSISLYKITKRRGSATLLTLRKNIRNRKLTYKNVFQKVKSLLQLLLFTSNHRNRINTINVFINFIYNCNPIIIITTILVALTNLFQYKFTSLRMRRRNSCKTPPLTSMSDLRHLATLTQTEKPLSIAPLDCISPSPSSNKLNNRSFLR